MGGLLRSSDMWAPMDLQYGDPAYSIGGGRERLESPGMLLW